jgi:TRAP-type C4-dicarboxylate transport system substrate-binding protein
MRASTDAHASQLPAPARVVVLHYCAVRASAAIVAVTLCASAAAHAQTVIRMATAVPEGTAWWREIRTFQNAVEAETQGQVRINIYFGGIAGDELPVGERNRAEHRDIESVN